MYMRKRTVVILSCILAHIFICWLGYKVVFAIRYNRLVDSIKVQMDENSTHYWGTFTDLETSSSDGKYTAEYSGMHIGEYGDVMIVVNIRDAGTKKLVSSFIPARYFDFWGICWEEGTHNLWIQSGDTGIACYREQDGEWLLDEDAVRPESIVSKSEAEAQKK